MTMSILELAGTFGLRETMIISLFDRLNSKHKLAKALGLLLCSLFSSAGYGLEIGSPAGLQQIGKRLDLQSNVTGIPAGSESQLRSTCLKARARPAGRRGVDAFEGLGHDSVQADFVPTIRQGGVIQFKSNAAIEDALVELQLISDCPLLAFTSSWTLIMEPEQAGRAVRSDVPELSGGSAFDLSNSSLLKASRVAPRRTAIATAAPKQQETPVQQPSGESVDYNAPAEIESNDPQTAGVESEPVQIAAIAPSFSEQGLIESRPAQVPSVNAVPIEHGSYWMGFDLKSPAMWVFVVSVVMLLAVTIAFGKSQLRQRGVSKTQVGRVEPPGMSEKMAFKEHPEWTDRADPIVVDASGAAQTYIQDRVLESLMGSDSKNSDQSYDDLKPLNTIEVAESQSRTSLSICLELINKADIRVWSLPEGYQALVAARNKSLNLHRTADALLLRCQVGLVELAFQEARKSRRLPEELVQELLKVVTGNHDFDLDATPALCVPDVVKSHVRAKMCEISGLEKRTLLQENLVNLNSQIENPGLCFSSNAWREFLSEEGILD